MPSLRTRSRNSKIKYESDVKKKRKLSAGQIESPVKKVKTDMKDEPTDSVYDLSDTENNHMDHVKLREENLRLNQEFLDQLGIHEAKQNLLASQKKNRPTQRGLKNKRHVPAEILPRRSSLRLQNKTPDGSELPPEARIPLYTPYEPEQHLRPPSGNLEMLEYLHGSSEGENHVEIRQAVSSLNTKPFTESKTSLDKYISNMAKTKLTAERVAKVVPERSFSLTVHPSATKIITAAGDKWGKIGIWDVLCDSKSSADGVCCYKPHSRPVTCLDFPVHSPEKLYSCGYDGSLRCGDLEKEIFTEVYSEPEEDDVLFRNFSWVSSHTMLVSQSTGCVSLVDIRTDSHKAEKTYNLHNRSLRTVSVHPMQSHNFCTAGVEGVVRVWDLRKIKEKTNKHVGEMHVTRGINSAYFSPVTGKYILSTSMDDKLTVFDCSDIGPNIKTKKSISHNNHTGRWLTPFRASWHPAREDMFVVGSMNRPREISLFGVDGKKLHSFKNEDYLGSVCSLNVLHPTLDLMIGTNSSGRLHVFM